MSNLSLFEATFTEDLYLVPPPTTIVLSSPYKDLTEAEVDLLSKILHAVRLSLSSVRIVEAQTLDLSQWTEKPNRLIGFGITVAGINPYELISTPETRLILADSLSELSTNEELKKRLWIVLKQLFFGP